MHFLLELDANKTEIKKAIESKFDVKVLKVSTIRQLGKVKQMTVRSGGRTIRTSGKKSDYKKAIITLDSGSKIDIMRGETQVSYGNKTTKICYTRITVCI